MSLDVRVRVDGEPESLRELAHPRLGGADVEQEARPCVGSLASTMFSATVITGISMKCWCTMPTPASIAARGEPSATGFPLMRISPSSGRYSP